MTLFKKYSLRVNFSMMFSSSFLSAFLRWGIVCVIVKLGGKQGPEMLGLWTLAQALTMPVMYITDLNLRTVLITDSKRTYPLNHFFALRLITNFVLVTIVTIICIIMGIDLYRTICIVLFSISTGVFSFRELFMAISIRNESTKINAKIGRAHV